MVKVDEEDVQKYLPLSESTYYILVSLIEPLHGYGVMQKVETISEGTAVIGPGTLYGTFSQLEKEGLIVKVSEEDRRKSFRLTGKGKKLLLEQTRRLELMTKIGREAMRGMA